METSKPPSSPQRAGNPFLRLLIPPFERTPVDLRILGRILLHAAVVGAAAGLLGAAFTLGLDTVQHHVLEGIGGYIPLRAFGERGEGSSVHAFRPWLLWTIPALGALGGGLLSAWLAPETEGGGGDAMIDAFHHAKGVIRRRVVAVKALASICTLGAGGSGGREGPTMQIGAAIGSVVGRYLKVDVRERRILLVAGCAAGMSAVFRTPFGAALLAVEVLYRDDFESDALIPALLASVVAYSVFVGIYGESTLFAHAAHYAFVPAHLPIYAAMALFICGAAIAFSSLLHAVKAYSKRVRLPLWARPAMGGLSVGIIATGAIALLATRIGQPGQGFGILGGGYGAAQIAISGASWMPTGWRAVELLMLLGAVKIVVTSLTVGSGGSAGDFGPSLVIGGLFGGAFGYAAQLLTHDPRIDPGAFALVGMGTFYGGLAHVPISSLVMTCELAGSYDLLVPLMLAEGIAFVALRNRSLYHAQLGTKAASPAHAGEMIAAVLEKKTVADILERGREFVSFSRVARVPEIMSRIAASAWQDIFPVLDEAGTIVGVIDARIVRTLVLGPEGTAATIAADLMQVPIFVRPDEGLHAALQKLITRGLRELPVVDVDGRIVGFLDEADVTLAYLNATKTGEEVTRVDSVVIAPPS